MSTTTATIPLGQLSHLPETPARPRRAPTEFAELVASINAHGLLENLVVSPTGNDIYEVVAGARRFDALHVLAKAGDVPADLGVPCTVIENGADISEISLAENMVRVAMHPADQVEAFCRLHEQGSTVEEIANRFGITESLVTKRIRLGGVAPALLKAYRAGQDGPRRADGVHRHRRSEASGRGLQAAQRQGRHVSAWAVKRTLTEAKVSANRNVARYVGLAAYEKAGGTVSRDLFAADHDEGVYLDDPALVERLATEKLEKTAAKLRKQWKWADVVLENIYEVTHGYDRVYAGPGEATEEGAEAAGRDRDRVGAADRQRGEPRPDLGGRRCAACRSANRVSEDLRRRSRGARSGLRSSSRSPGAWSPSATTGRATSPRATSSPRIGRRRARPRAAAGSATAQGRATRPRTLGRRPGSARRSPTTWRRSAPRWSRSSCSTTRRIAQDLLTFGLVRDLLFDDRYLGEDALDVRGSATALRPTSRMADKTFVKSSPGEPVLVSEGKRLRKKFEWIKVAKEAEVIAAFRKFRKQKPETKAAVLAYCVALTVKNQLSLAVDPERRPGARGGDRRDDARLQAGAAVEGSPVEPGLQADHARDPDRDRRRGLCGDAGLQEEGRAQPSTWPRLFANPSADEFGLTAEAQKRVLDWAPIGFQPAIAA